MLKVTFVDHQGVRRIAEAREGSNLMEAARRGDIPGIVAQCGGACACATCKVDVDPAWTARVGEPGAMEADMLEMAGDCGENSRLACQITLVPALDGLVVTTPESQY